MIKRLVTSGVQTVGYTMRSYAAYLISQRLTSEQDMLVTPGVSQLVISDIRYAGNSLVSVC